MPIIGIQNWWGQILLLWTQLQLTGRPEWVKILKINIFELYPKVMIFEKYKESPLFLVGNKAKKQKLFYLLITPWIKEIV